MKLLLLLALSLGLTACRGQIKLNEDTATYTKNEVIQLKTKWVKDKGGKFDIEIFVRNIAGKPIVFKLNEMSCARGDEAGELKHTLFNSGERHIDFNIGETKMFRMVCRTGGKPKGEFKVTINKVYDNPSGDGLTPGAQIAGPIEWTTRLEK